MLLELKQELDLLLASTPAREIHAARRSVEGHRSGHVDYKGKVLVDFTSWDYFNLAAQERVKRAAHEELESSGVGSGASRTSSGTTAAHLLCEDRFAKFMGAESALLLSSRNQAYFSLLTAVLSERDVVIAEEQLQAPVADAAHLVGASFGQFSIRDLGSLVAELERNRLARRKIVVCESLVSITGEVAPLTPLSQACSVAGASLWVDESYAVGCIGPRGAGGTDAEHAQLGGKIDCKIIELGPVLGSSLAVVAGSALLVSLLVQRSRALSLEPSPSPALAAGIRAAVDVLELMPSARDALLVKAELFRSGLREISKFACSGSGSPVVSMQTPSPSIAREFVAGLFSRGFLAEVVSSKRLFSDEMFVRFIVNASHAESVIEATLAASRDVLSLIRTRS